MQLRRLEQHQLQLRHIRQRQEQERLQRAVSGGRKAAVGAAKGTGEATQRAASVQLQQQQQEHRLRRQLLQRQLEMEAAAETQTAVTGERATVSPGTLIWTLHHL